VARGGISAICPQDPSIGIRPVVAQAQGKLALLARIGEDRRVIAQHRNCIELLTASPRGVWARGRCSSTSSDRTGL
jgi:hypothetical protein